ncbi:porin family protein [Gracilimonas sp.]|uniref:porin family protein n=1 Tax=Gracilimonas sp. TaxID=1974203 RepID=UPI002872597B|nr:porin family protein [Gracilimonas sp.]
MRRIILLITIGLILFTGTANAQLEIGGSYELRNEDPKNGFGLRIQKGILGSVPVVDLGIRLHASFFSEEFDRDNLGQDYSIEYTNYDVGVAGYGGVSLGLIQPYAGIGIGTENYEAVVNNYSVSGDLNPEGDESNLYWNLFTGAKVTVIPMVKPFVEYRYSNKELSSPTLADAQSGRIMFGVLLSF